MLTKTTLLRYPMQLALLAGLLAMPASAQREIVMRDFKVPELDDQGNKKSLLVGKEARLKGRDPARITGLTIYIYGRDGEESVKVTSPACTYDQKTRKARSREPVRIQGRSFVVEGVGFEYLPSVERMRIHSNAKVTLENMGTFSKPNEETQDAE